MSEDIVNVQQLEHQTLVQKIFKMFREPSMRGLSEDGKQHIERIIEIAKLEASDEPMTFVEHLAASTPTHYPMGESNTRLGQVHMAAELYHKTAQKRRVAATEAFRAQQEQARGV